MGTCKRIISLSVALSLTVNVFAQTTGTGMAGIYNQTAKAVRTSFACDLKKYPAGANCDCHRYIYQQNIKNNPMGGGGHGAGGAAGASNIAMQRRCMHAYNEKYSDYSQYTKELAKIPQSLVSPSETNKGDIQAQYLFNKETSLAFQAAGDKEKAAEFFGKNVEILIANLDKSWAAKTIMLNLYKGNLSVEEKEAALQTLYANLPNIGRCKAGVCHVPGTVGDVSGLFTNCAEDACLLTALHIELLNSLIQSGASSASKDDIVNMLSGLLIKNIGSEGKARQNRFGDKEANAIVKLPILKAILELGGEEKFLEITQKILEKQTLTYSNADTEVMVFIVESYATMNKYDPIIDLAFNQNKNKVAKVEAMMALADAEEEFPGILQDDEKQKIANYLHYSYADETTACVTRNQEGQRTGGHPILAGGLNSGETDAMLKQKICNAYTKLDTESTVNNVPCFPCDGNLDKDGGVIVAETLLSFAMDDVVDDIVFGVLTLGAGIVATKMIKGAKYAKKIKKLANKVSKLKNIGNHATDSVVSGVKVTRKTRQVRKARTFSLKKLSNGKTVAQWSDAATDATRAADNVADITTDAGRVANTGPVARNTKRGQGAATGAGKAAQPNVGTRIEQEARDIGNQFDASGDLTRVAGNADTPSVHGDANLPNQPMTVATQKIPANSPTPRMSAEEAKAFQASQERISLRNQRIAEIDAEIEQKSKGLGGLFNKKRIKELEQERDMLKRQADVDKALSNPRIKVEQRQYGFVASADGIDAHLSQAELDKYLKDLNPEELDNFYKRNPNLKPEGYGQHVDDVVDAARGADNLTSAAPGSTLRETVERAEVPKGHEGEIDDIFRSMDAAQNNPNLTPAQRESIDRAREYFNNLTPEQLADESLYKSAAFRENAARLKSPTATEHGFYIDANGGISAGAVEEGYIPHMISNGEEALPFGDVRQLFSTAEKTDKPIFVRLDVHGEIDDAGKFYFIFGDIKSNNRVYPEELVDALQDLRRTSGTPEIDLYSGACHSGQFLDEFAKLPANKREGINIFATAGSPLQVNSTGNVGLVRTRGVGSIKDAQFDNIVNVIGDKGNIFARGYVDGEMFDPLNQSLLRANSDPQYSDLVERLEVLNDLHTSTDGKSIQRTIRVDYQFAGGEWSPSIAAGDAFDTECLGMDQDIVNFVKETATQMRSGKRW